MRFIPIQILSLTLVTGMVCLLHWFVWNLAGSRLDGTDLNQRLCSFHLPHYEDDMFRHNLPLPPNEAVCWHVLPCSRISFALLLILVGVQVLYASWYFDTSIDKRRYMLLAILDADTVFPSNFMDSKELVAPLLPLSLLMPLVVVCHLRMVVFSSCSGTASKIVTSQILGTKQYASFPSLNLSLAPPAHLAPFFSSSTLYNPQEATRAQLIFNLVFILVAIEFVLLPNHPPSLVGFEIGSELVLMFLLNAVTILQHVYLTAICVAVLLAVMVSEACLSHGDINWSCQNTKEDVFFEGYLAKLLVMSSFSPLFLIFNNVVCSSYLCLINMWINALLVLVYSLLVLVYSFDGE